MYCLVEVKTGRVVETCRKWIGKYYMFQNRFPSKSIREFDNYCVMWME